jgi:hypothetical protein
MKRAHREPGRHTPLCVTNQIKIYTKACRNCPTLRPRPPLATPPVVADILVHHALLWPLRPPADGSKGQPTPYKKHRPSARAPTTAVCRHGRKPGECCAVWVGVRATSWQAGGRAGHVVRAGTWLRPAAHPDLVRPCRRPLAHGHWDGAQAPRTGHGARQGRACHAAKLRSAAHPSAAADPVRRARRDGRAAGLVHGTSPKPCPPHTPLGDLHRSIMLSLWLALRHRPHGHSRAWGAPSPELHVVALKVLHDHSCRGARRVEGGGSRGG